jgi:hypothetical protein
MGVQGSSIAWEHDVDGAIDKARADQRHVLVDFSAAPM